jgi:dUTP pyrophosphatase
MADITVQVIVEEGAVLPLQTTSWSAGSDLSAKLDTDITLAPMQRALIPTGLKLSIPEGYEGQVRPRSGLALRHGVTVLNTPGTIDADYRGEVKVILINLGSEDFIIKNGERIAQLVIAPTCCTDYVSVQTLSDTERGEGGFGSTGV